MKPQEYNAETKRELLHLNSEMQTFAKAVADFRSLLSASPLNEVTDPDAIGSVNEGWTRKQILGHLIDSAANNHHRFVRAQIEGELTMPDYAGEKWVATQNYRDLPWVELVQLWSAYNRHLLYLMQTVQERQREKICRIGDGEPVTLEFLMIDYVRHLQHHLDQILDKIEA